MRIVRFHVDVMLCVAVISALASCARPAEVELGSLSLNLAGQASSGTVYRLRDARIAVHGPAGTTIWDTEAAPDQTSISAEVPTGEYLAVLIPGWRFERVDRSGAALPVTAVLISENPAHFTIVPGQRTFVPLRFRIDTGEVDLTQGYDLGIVVDEPPAIRNPSCVRLPPSCGVRHNDTCCSSPRVPGGVYFRDYDLAGDVQSGDTAASATLSDFRLDRYEVTVGRFRAFVMAGMGTQTSPPAQDAGAHAVIAHSGWDASWNQNLPHTAAELSAGLLCGLFPTWADQSGSNDNKPINCVSWYLAMAFCIWDGGYLPTEAEWNYAATGGDQQRAFAWSNPPGSLAIDRFHASYAVPFDGTSVPRCVGNDDFSCDEFDVLEVGSLPAGDGRWGQSDLNGNVEEWTLDQAPAQHQIPCVDCANVGDPSLGAGRSFRGGSYTAFELDLRSSARFFAAGDATADTRGFRCARAP